MICPVFVRSVILFPPEDRSRALAVEWATSHQGSSFRPTTKVFCALMVIVVKRRLLPSISIYSESKIWSVVLGLKISIYSESLAAYMISAVSYTHLRAHETRHDLVCRL